MDFRWKQWIKTNLNNGSDPAEIRDILLRNKFKLADIKREMGKRFPNEEQVKLSAADYERLANIRLTRTATPVDTRTVQMYTIAHFMTPEECDTLIEISMGKLVPSGLAGTERYNDTRTSSTCILSKLNHPFVTSISQRIGETLGLNPAFSEGIEIQRYEVGQRFIHHTDYFNPGSEEYKRYASVRGNRTWTFMVYLNDVEQGGGTNFHYLDLTFQPRKGTAVIWNNLTEDGTPNPHTLHAGMPVEKGFKVVITDWYRELGDGPMFL